MKILALDTSTALLSVALGTETAWAESSLALGLTHSERLFPIIDFLSRQAQIDLKDLDLVVCSKGPGSFTGLRIGFSAAKGISMAAECPLISVPTLDAYAFEFRDLHGAVVPIIDGKKKRLFTAVYKKGTRQGEYMDITPADLSACLDKIDPPIFLCGPDPEVYLSYLSNREIYTVIDDFSSGKATCFLKIGIELYNQGKADSDGSGPVYLRESEAEINLHGKK